ncbi:MAG: hypothetical protein ACRERR_14850 [Moraxellaceae bacterium]
MKKGRGVFAPALFIFLFGFMTACSSQQVYQSSQGLRESECDRIMDVAKREACLQEASKSWPEYEQGRKEAGSK